MSSALVEAGPGESSRQRDGSIMAPAEACDVTAVGAAPERLASCSEASTSSSLTSIESGCSTAPTNNKRPSEGGSSGAGGLGVGPESAGAPEPADEAAAAAESGRLERSNSCSAETKRTSGGGGGGGGGGAAVAGAGGELAGPTATSASHGDLSASELGALKQSAASAGFFASKLNTGSLWSLLSVATSSSAQSASSSPKMERHAAWRADHQQQQEKHEQEAFRLSVKYTGSAQLHKNFTLPMLEWVAKDVRRQAGRAGGGRELVLELAGDCITGVSARDKHALFVHPRQQVSKYAQLQHDATCFAYLTRDSKEAAVCHVFQAKSAHKVHELFAALRGGHRWPAEARPPGLALDNSYQFEVLFVKKVKLQCRRVPASFVDDALETVRSFELLKAECKGRAHCISAPVDERQEYDAEPEPEAEAEADEPAVEAPAERAADFAPYSAITSSGLSARIVASSSSGSLDQESRRRLAQQVRESIQAAAASLAESRPSAEVRAKPQSGGRVKNRTMLLLIGRQALSTISIDKHQLLFSKPFSSIVHVCQGRNQRDHFGLICRNGAKVVQPTADSYAGLIFKCQSDKVVREVMAALKQVLHSAQQAWRAPEPERAESLCEACPLHWFHRLCCDVESLEADATKSIILRRVEWSVSERDRDQIYSRLADLQVGSVEEHNALFMSLLRHLCERQQTQHAHSAGHLAAVAAVASRPTVQRQCSWSEQRPAHQRSGSSGGGSLAAVIGQANLADAFAIDSLKRAKKSISVSIENLLKRTGSGRPSDEREDASAPSSRSGSFRLRPTEAAELRRSQSSSDYAQQVSWRDSLSRLALNDDLVGLFRRRGSLGAAGSVECLAGGAWAAPRAGRSRAELRALWRKAIRDQITLLKMEKQNARLRAPDLEPHLKLNYRDLSAAPPDAWAPLLDAQPAGRVELARLAGLVRAGVPKQRRGQLWRFLMRQYQVRHGASFQPADAEFQADANRAYGDLLSQLSVQQHEIFVDIGRTFPTHPYYSQYLSIGQLALFNLLKAYSLLDPEVGYCQGLSFVAGILLLHVEREDDAFELMRHLLFNFGLRGQYLPSMRALQLQLYQLARLLRDHQPDLCDHLEALEVSPSLYAAPWFLTLFASHFPLAFVARLLDLVFLVGIEAVFRVALELLAEHRARLLECRSLEAAMEYLRQPLTRMEPAALASLFERALALDLRNQLIEYEIEYAFQSAGAPAGSAAADTQALASDTADLIIQHLVANNHLKTLKPVGQ